jgi:glycosyltransferase involved in cell wall biosynthesis
LRIAYLVSQYPAPSHTFVRREVAALRALGLEVDTFSIRPGVSLSDADRTEASRTFCVLPAGPLDLVTSQVRTLARRPGRWVLALGVSLRHRLPGARSLVKSLAYFLEAMRLATELERRGSTHLHNHFANAAAQVGLAAARYLDIGWSVTLHGLSDFAGPTTPLLTEKVAQARFVATATHHGRAQAMHRSDPRHWDRLHVIRCGVDVERLPAPRGRARAPEAPLELLAVGRLAPEKGHVGLVEALALAVERGVDARLSLIGGGPEEARIRAAIAARGLQGRVELLGARPEQAVLEAMARADALVVSSFAEGLPVVLMEALAMELPVIAPAIAGIPELVAHRETGLLFVAGRWDELAERIAELASDPALRARLAAAGRARVLQEFDARRAAEPLARLFREAHAGARR